MNIQFTLNDKKVSWNIEGNENLRDVLREKGIVSVRNGCDGEGSCGLCAIIYDGKNINSCLLLAQEAHGHTIFTVEYFSKNGTLSLIQEALLECGCVQCGYCTPAVVLSIHTLIQRSGEPTRAEISDALSGTMCRCTGYEQYYKAVRLAAKRVKDPSYKELIAKEFRDDLTHVGKVREKVDSRSLVKGERAFVQDRVDQNTCYIKVMPSPHAHARIKKLDASKALEMTGVVDIAWYENTPSTLYTSAGQGYPEPSPYDRRLFSQTMCFVGDRVCAVLAESEAIAEAALKVIHVEYEVLPHVLTMEEAAKEGSYPVHGGNVKYMAGGPKEGSSIKGNGIDDDIIYQFPIGADPHKNLAASVSDGIGDTEKGFKEADIIIEREYSGTRVQCTPMEMHIVLAKMEQGRLVIHASTQVPWHLRRIVAKVIGISENKVRVIKERVGGGFGAKQDIVLEDVAAWFAYKNNRACLYHYTREEEFVASRTRHPMKIKVKLGAKKDGKLTAIEMNIRADTGAFGTHCLTVPMNACSKSLPLVLCDNVHFDVKTYYTNMPQAGAYQGYGAPKGSFALQTALAELAAELKMDQLEILEKNMVKTGSVIEILKSLGEGRAGAAVTLGECGLEEMVKRGKEETEWNSGTKPSKKAYEAMVHDPRSVPNPFEKTNKSVKFGHGAVIIQQGSGLPGLDAANAEVRLLSDGTFLLLSGGADLGTGLDTVTVKAVAETLKVSMQSVAVISGDTDITPFDKGAYASSGTFFSGNAALLAAQDLEKKLLHAAAERLDEKVEELEIIPGGIIKGKKGQITYKEIAHETTTGEGFGEMSGRACFKTEHAAFPYGAHFVEVAVNEETGDVKLLSYRAYQDCGTPINPELAMGQVFGGVMKAVGHSLYEEMLFDDKGKCINANFVDYKTPTIYETPGVFTVDFVPVHDPVGPFGGKSVSEISLNGAAPAIAIAIHDAVGVWVREWPFTSERILKALGKIQ